MLQYSRSTLTLASKPLIISVQDRNPKFTFGDGDILTLRTSVAAAYPNALQRYNDYGVFNDPTSTQPTIPQSEVTYYKNVYALRDSIRTGFASIPNPLRPGSEFAVMYAYVKDLNNVVAKDPNKKGPYRGLKMKAELTKNQMINILNFAVYNKHRDIVIASFGEDKFGYDGPIIADLWEQVLLTPHLQGRIDQIIFSNYGKSQATKQAFYDRFDPKGIQQLQRLKQTRYPYQVRKTSNPAVPLTKRPADSLWHSGRRLVISENVPVQYIGHMHFPGLQAIS